MRQHWCRDHLLLIDRTSILLRLLLSSTVSLFIEYFIDKTHGVPSSLLLSGVSEGVGYCILLFTRAFGVSLVSDMEEEVFEDFKTDFVDSSSSTENINNNTHHHHHLNRSSTLDGLPVNGTTAHTKQRYYRANSLPRSNSLVSPTHFPYTPTNLNGRSHSPSPSCSSDGSSWFRATFRAPSSCR